MTSKYLEKVEQEHRETLNFEKRKVLIDIYKDLIQVFIMKLRCESKDDKIEQIKIEIFEAIDMMMDI